MNEPLDFTRPLELVCDGTEVAYLMLIEGFAHLRKVDGSVILVDQRGHWRGNPTGPQIVRNRVEEAHG